MNAYNYGQVLVALALLGAVTPASGQRLAQVSSDQGEATNRTRAGDLLPLSALFAKASAAGRGEYLGVDFDQDTSTYRFKFMRPNGSVVAVDVDGRTGRVLRTQ